ncbi:MAG: hypothetical protein V3S17_03480, partial [candidate division Zixibacteria bacterium]
MSKSAAIILSRQQLRPSLCDSWVRKLIDAVNFVKNENMTLISSVGSRNWEIITACAVLNSVPLRLLLPARGFSSFKALKPEASRQYCLTDSQVEFVEIGGRNLHDPTLAQLANRRDEIIIDQADVLIPVSVRPNGKM